MKSSSVAIHKQPPTAKSIPMLLELQLHIFPFHIKWQQCSCDPQWTLCHTADFFALILLQWRFLRKIGAKSLSWKNISFPKHSDENFYDLFICFHFFDFFFFVLLFYLLHYSFSFPACWPVAYWRIRSRSRAISFSVVESHRMLNFEGKKSSHSDNVLIRWHLHLLLLHNVKLQCLI